MTDVHSVEFLRFARFNSKGFQGSVPKVCKVQFLSLQSSVLRFLFHFFTTVDYIHEHIWYTHNDYIYIYQLNTCRNSHLFKKGLRLAKDVLEFCQLQKALHECFIIRIAIFHFIFQLLKLGLKKLNSIRQEFLQKMDELWLKLFSKFMFLYEYNFEVSYFIFPRKSAHPHY